MDNFKSGLNKFIKVYDEMLCAFGCFFYLSFVFCVLVQIISRNLLPSCPSWTEELARYTFIYMVAFGGGVAVTRNEFVNVEFMHEFLERLNPNIDKLVTLLIKVAIMALCLFILIQAELGFVFIKFTMYSTALVIPMQYIYFSQILLFGFLIFSYVLEIVRSILAWNDKTKEVA